MNYKFEIKDIEPISVAALRFKGHVTDAAKQFPKVFKSIKGKANGAPLFCYNSIDENTSMCDLELCVPTAETPNANGISLKELPGVKALCLTHIGSYDGLKVAYEEIHRHIQENGLTIQPPWREIYVKGPGMILKGNPNNYITEIQFPLKEG